MPTINNDINEYNDMHFYVFKLSFFDDFKAYFTSLLCMSSCTDEIFTHIISFISLIFIKLPIILSISYV